VHAVADRYAFQANPRFLFSSALFRLLTPGALRAEAHHALPLHQIGAQEFRSGPIACVQASPKVRNLR
jgi:hypothetical protein